MALTLKILTVIIVSRVCEVISYVYVVDFFIISYFNTGRKSLLILLPITVIYIYILPYFETTLKYFKRWSQNNPLVQLLREKVLLAVIMWIPKYFTNIVLYYIVLTIEILFCKMQFFSLRQWNTFQTRKTYLFWRAEVSMLC